MKKADTPCLLFLYIKQKLRTEVLSLGATDRNRTGDLILTKDVLYQLSHSSICYCIIAEVFLFVKFFFYFVLHKSLKYSKINVKKGRWDNVTNKREPL